MKTGTGTASYYIGWDVGGWNCDNNAKSRDAIVILDESRNIIGTPWRGNLRESINRSQTTKEWINALFSLCNAEVPNIYKSIILAIDTPLGFSEEFIALISGHMPVDEIGESSENHYLYRKTEKYLIERGKIPLSPIKDMIGSQATKGMHVLAKFAPSIESCGVWSGRKGFRAIEAYPSMARNAPSIRKLLKGKNSLGNDDKNDAHVCAIVAYLFHTKRDQLVKPINGISKREGWIWFPKDTLNEKGHVREGER